MDGTLLPMDAEVFTKRYFSLLAQKISPLGYGAKELIDGIWEGVRAMVENDGSLTNEERFWQVFSARFGERVFGDIPVFDSFYRNEFAGAKEVCGFQPAAKGVVEGLHAKGIRTVLATNPVFPMTAQHMRIGWAGLEPEDFLYITSYENSRFCKPNPRYFLEICDKCGLDPKDCLMVGNDAEEDYAARRAGIEVFLITDCLINRKGRELSSVPHGDFSTLRSFLELD